MMMLICTSPVKLYARNILDGFISCAPCCHPSGAPSAQRASYRTSAQRAHIGARTQPILARPH